MVSKYIMGRGWFKESERHRLARLGIKTGRKTASMGYGLSKVNYQKHPLPPQHILQAPLPDKDKDKIPDIYDWDDDNDGVPDWKDTEGMFSIDRFKGKGVFDPFYESTKDSDFDGVPDYKDLHPHNPHKASDWAKLSIMDMKKKYVRLHKYVWGTEGSKLPSFKYKHTFSGKVKLDPKKAKALKRAWLQKRINEVEWKAERKKGRLKKGKILAKAREKIVTMNEPKMKKMLEKTLNKKVDKVVIRKNPLTKETEVSYKLKHRKGWTRINFAKYKGYDINVKKVGKDSYNWNIKGKSGYTGKKTIFGKGLALVENKKMAENVAKEYVNKKLLHL